MFVIVKGFAGFDYTLKSGKKISLKGGAYLNEVSKTNFAALLKEFPSVQEDVDSGYIVVNSNEGVAKKQSEVAVDDTKQETADKQKASQAKANVKESEDQDL